MKEEIDHFVKYDLGDVFATDIFDDQVVEAWDAKGLKEVLNLTGEDVEFVQVTYGGFIKGGLELYKLGVKHGVKAIQLMRDRWQKAVQAYKGDLVKGLKIDKSVENKLTQELGNSSLSNNAKGLRWGDIKGNNQVRIMKGRKDAQFECQQRDYVQVRRGGQVIGRNQKEVKPTSSFPSPGDNPEAHIPYEEWVNWPTLLGE